VSLDGPRLVLIAGAACILVALEFGGRALLRDGKIELGRRVYWTGWAVGIPLFLLATWGDLVKTTAMAGLWGGIAVGYAYLLTPYLRIRGRIYALGVTRRRYTEAVGTTPRCHGERGARTTPPATDGRTAQAPTGRGHRCT
jgi:hypothetical protein